MDDNENKVQKRGKGRNDVFDLSLHHRYDAFGPYGVRNARFTNDTILRGEDGWIALKHYWKWLKK
jgi:hypothetical protein